VKFVVAPERSAPFALALLCAPALLHAQAGPWFEHPVGRPGPSRGLCCADLDGDGDPDLVNRQQWYENAAGDGSSWVEHPLADEARTVVDLDGDGDLDALGFEPLGVYWLDNASGDGSVFVRRSILVPVTFLFGADVRAGDLDGDLDLDVVFAETGQDALLWFENENGDESSWRQRTLSSATVEPSSTDLADVDGDGDLDLLTGDEAGYQWYENPADRALVWPRRVVRASVDQKPRRVRAGDFDGDSDVDAAFASQGDMSSSDAIGWFENAAGDGTSWILRLVSFDDAPASSSYLAAPVDLDRDGDLDLLRGELEGIAWSENQDGLGGAWADRALDRAATTALFADADAADIDLDGDRDVAEVQGSFLATDVVWLENRTPVTPYGSDVNPPRSLWVASGAFARGSALVLALANPLGTQRAGTRTYLAVASQPAPGFPAGVLRPGMGMAGPGATGEVLVSTSAPNPLDVLRGTDFGGAGSPGLVTTAVPDSAFLVGRTFYLQGLLLDAGSTTVRVGLTNALRATISP
jgi:hypothetical protein